MRPQAPDAGQALAEYAVIMAAIAVFCILALAFLGAGISERFRSSGETTRSTNNPAPSVPLTPPVSSSTPKTLADCEDGAWRNYAQFKSEGECKDHVRGMTP